MIYALKLLFPVLVVCALAGMFLRPAFAPLLEPRQYARVWLIIVIATVVAFLGQSTVIYGLGVLVIARFARSYLGGNVRANLAAFMLLVVILPPLTWQLGGLGDINYLLALTGPRLLALALLVGPAVQLLGDRRIKRERWVAPLDFAVVGYQLLKIVLAAPGSPGTTVLRSMLESVLDVLLPYFVMSRAIRTESDMRFILSHGMLGLVFQAAVGFTEFFVHRDLYSELQWVYGYKWQLTMNLMRGDHLRVQAATPQPIVFAFEMIFALGLWTYLRGRESKQWPVRWVFILLVCSLLFTFSRGPWIGALTFGGALLAARRLPVKSFVALLATLAVVAVLVKMTGVDTAVIAMLGGVFGSSEADMSSILYRNQLLDTALALLKQSPWLGVPNYAAQMQDLRQGEGIIDLVNSYVAIALDTGVIGLVVYLLPYVLILRRLLREPGLSRRDPGPRGDASAGWFAATLLAMSIAMLLTIFTTSVFFTMPFMLILLIALPIARLSMKAEEVDIPLEIKPPPGHGLHQRAVILR